MYYSLIKNTMFKSTLSVTFFSYFSIFAMSQEELSKKMSLKVAAKNTKNVKELLDQGANANILIDGISGLEFCYRQNLPKMFELLVNNGANINSAEATNFLGFCCINNLWKIFDKLILKGANINEPCDSEGSNLAMYYFNTYKYDNKKKYKLSVYTKLILHGLNVNTVDNNGNNFLHIILKQYNYHNDYLLSEKVSNIINLFICAGIDISKKNNNEQTSYYFGYKCQDPNIRTLFCKAANKIRNFDKRQQLWAECNKSR